MGINLLGIKNCLYYARVNKIEFVNFRNIEKGEIELPNSKTNDFLEEKPSVLGIYGQNGSGKSSVIMALGILKDVLSGKALGENYKSCIRFGCKNCSLKFTFKMYGDYIPDSGATFRKDDKFGSYDVFYEFDITKVENDVDEMDLDVSSQEFLRIENEALKYRSVNSGRKVSLPKQTFIDTRSVSSGKKLGIFGSALKERMYTLAGANTDQFRENLVVTASKSQSFIFSSKTIKLIENSFDEFAKKDEVMQFSPKFVDECTSVTNEQDFKNIISNISQSENDSSVVGKILYFFLPYYLVQILRAFGSVYLHVIDTVATGVINTNTKLPLLLWHKNSNGTASSYRVPLQISGPTNVYQKYYEPIKLALKSISDVLEKVIPGIGLNFVDLGMKLTSNGEEAHSFEVTIQRGETCLPLKYESDGIRRIVSVLSLLIAAYNDSSFTVVIDEIDSGIFEYLLGEILSIMSESAKGQLIFTSHNLRALEVMPSKFLCFTTTDPDNRFMTINNRGNSNLRDTYFRKIKLNSEKNPVYAPTDKHEIELAFQKAGHHAAVNEDDQ